MGNLLVAPIIVGVADNLRVNQIAVQVVLVAVGGDVAAVICGLNDFAFAVVLVLCVVIHTRVDVDGFGCGFKISGDLVIQLAGIISGVGADEGNMDIAVGDGGIDPDGMGGVVAEAVVQIAPVDRGIHAEGNIVGLVLVLPTLDDFQIGLDGAVENNRCDLTDTAAGLVFGTAADINRSRAVALFGGALTDDLVEGEDLAGTDNGAVDSSCRQLKIVGADVAVGGVRAVIRGQNVTEQFLLQRLDGVLRFQLAHRQDDGFAGLCGFKRRHGILHQEAKAVFALCDLIGFLVADGVDRFDALILFIQGVQINGLRNDLVINILHLEIAAGVGFDDLVKQGADFDIALDRAQVDLQSVHRLGVAVPVGEGGGGIFNMGFRADADRIFQRADQRLTDIVLVGRDILG